jgi:hypothetical protein
MTAVLPYAITLNPSHGFRFTDGQILATRIPAGCWMVKVRQRGDGWAAFAVLCDGAVDDQFDIATGVDREAVWLTAVRWVESATTAVMRFDRFVFVGLGDSFGETGPADVPAGDAERDAAEADRRWCRMQLLGPVGGMP